jgi:hypothetical protein
MGKLIRLLILGIYVTHQRENKNDEWKRIKAPAVGNR